MEANSSADKVRQISRWLNNQSEAFNENFSSVRDIEKIYDLATVCGYDYMDDLQADLIADPIPEAVKLAKATNKAFGFDYYCL